MKKSIIARKGFRLAELGDPPPGPGKKDYKKKLKELQLAMLEIQLAVRRQRARVAIVIEGTDAAGKGGAIRRMVEVLDPRSVRVWSIGKPTPEEAGTHWLARFWAKLPDPKMLAVFDRSWYGRVLVERVEGFAAEAAWKRGYDEINEFEAMLVDDGILLIKLYVHVSQDEQLERFRRRLANPAKRWKMTPEDMRNRAHWPQYREALEDMIDRTSTRRVPWHFVYGDDKRYARLAVLRTITRMLRQHLDLAPPAPDPEFAKAALEYFGPPMLKTLGLDAPATQLHILPHSAK
jgi:polyphosphate kinase 2 (PPK2 family)